ncbi:MAG: NUDIX domain-containing protein [Anaerolineales bacterium]|nr:NUDIX domain-containing protein [Anaerolineales bacterium]
MTSDLTPNISELPQLPSKHRWHAQVRPVPSIIAILRTTKREAAYPPDAYLLIQRIKPPYMHKWGMVGGKWDFGESLEEAVAREVMEETGLCTSFHSLRGIMNERILPLDQNTPGGHYVLFVCELRVAGGTAQEKYEGPVRWFGYNELQSKAAEGEIIATDFALIQAFRHPPPHLIFIEAEVLSEKNKGKRIDRITRFDIFQEQNPDCENDYSRV